MSAAARLISAIDKARPEVVIDVELLEVDRTKLREYGLQIASPGSPGIDGSVSIVPQGDGTAVPRVTLQTLTQPDAGGHPAGESAVALLSAPEDRHEHADAGQSAAAHVGRHSGAGAVRRTHPGAGHDVHADRDRRRAAAADRLVQLREHRRQHRHHAAHAPRRRRDAGAEGLRCRAFPAPASTGCRRSANREINTEIRLRDGETNMLAGLIRDDERRVLDGIPGLSDLPGASAGSSRTRRPRPRRPTSS